METLVVSRNKSQISDRFGPSPSLGFKGINCRTFDSVSPHSSFPSFTSPSGPPKQSKRSSPIPINPKRTPKQTTTKPDTVDLCYSELWAGPAYSNSPPPSSLPIPKFSLRQNRSVSLELPTREPGIALLPVSKSAPASPARESCFPASDFFLNTASATENLRRILNLDITDD